MLRPPTLALLLPLLLLAGCPFGGADAAEGLALRREAEGKAIGGACRHAGRALEDCFALNKRADKAAAFAGWREMNDYMRENKIDAVPPLGAVVAEATDKPDKPEAADKARKGDEPAPDASAAKKSSKGKPQDS